MCPLSHDANTSGSRIALGAITNTAQVFNALDLQLVIKFHPRWRQQRQKIFTGARLRSGQFCPLSSGATPWPRSSEDTSAIASELRGSFSLPASVGALWRWLEPTCQQTFPVEPSRIHEFIGTFIPYLSLSFACCGEGSNHGLADLCSFILGWLLN